MANAQKGIVSPLLILDLRAEASKKDHNFFNGGLCNRYYDRSEQKPVKWPFWTYYYYWVGWIWSRKNAYFAYPININLS